MKNKISSLNISVLTLALNKSLFLGIIFSFLFKTSNTSALWGVLLGMVLSIPIYFMFLKIMDILPDKTIFEKIKIIFPGFLSKIINLIINLCVFLIGSYLLWRITSFIATEFLTDTSTIYILFLMTLPVLYLGINNIDTLGRFGFIALTVCFFVLIFNVVACTQYMDIDNFKPLFNDSFSSILKTGIYSTVFFTTPVFFLTIIKKDDLDKKEKFNKYIWLCFIESCISSMLIFITVLGVLGVDLLTMYTYPEFTVLKVINVFSFIENVENICTILWVFYLIISTSLSVMLIKKWIVDKYQITKKKKKGIVAIVVTLCMFIIVYFTKDYSYYIDKFYLVNIPFIVCAVLLFIMLLTLFVYSIKKKSIKKE